MSRWSSETQANGRPSAAAHWPRIGGLAVARRGNDADDATASRAGEALHQAGSLDESRPGRRDVELGPQELEPARLAPAGGCTMRSIVIDLRRRQWTSPSDPGRHRTQPRAEASSLSGERRTPSVSGGASEAAALRRACDHRRMRVSKRLLVAGGGVVLVAATFVFLLPRIADYRDVWDVVQDAVVGMDPGAPGGDGRQHLDLRAALARRPAGPPLLAGA